MDRNFILAASSFLSEGKMQATRIEKSIASSDGTIRQAPSSKSEEEKKNDNDHSRSDEKFLMGIKQIGLGIGLIILLLVVQPLRPVARFYHVPAPSFFGPFLDSDLRRRGQPPDKLIERSGIKLGMTVLDLGCGSGTYTLPAARTLGQQGKIYALDIDMAMLKQLERKLARPENRDIKNIELKLSSAYELPFADGSLDLVFMVTVLQEIPDKERALREISRVLKSEGVLAVTELLPDPDYPLRSTTIKQVQREGFLMTSVHGNAWNYTVRFRKSQ